MDDSPRQSYCLPAAAAPRQKRCTIDQSAIALEHRSSISNPRSSRRLDRRIRKRSSCPRVLRGSRKGIAAMTAPRYRLEGRLLEVCDCGVLCPCWIGEDPDNGSCDSALAYHFDSGT